MKGIGGLLVLLGIGSIILPYMGRQFSLLSWIDNWGPTVGWIIRGAMIVVGIILFIAAGKKTASE